jgi:hypothetical protein
VFICFGLGVSQVIPKDSRVGLHRFGVGIAVAVMKNEGVFVASERVRFIEDYAPRAEEGVMLPPFENL